jgi:MoaA/NifB/PqqE/SkfB family radical SAM enzyme
LSGGEPLQHPEWQAIASLFRQHGIRVAMATSGILLQKHAGAVPECIDELYISLDGAQAATYSRIRGVDGFDLVVKGIERTAGRVPVTVRTTVQRANYPEIPALIRLTRSLGAAHHSFLAVDVSTHAAFARNGAFDRSAALGAEDLDPFAAVLDAAEQEFAPEFVSGYLSEPPDKLRALHGYFAALLGFQPFTPVRCNAPRFSAVIETDGTLKPCFFLPPASRFNGASLPAALNTGEAKSLRRRQALGRTDECVRCVCPAYKDVRDLLEVS